MRALKGPQCLKGGRTVALVSEAGEIGVQVELLAAPHAGVNLGGLGGYSGRPTRTAAHLQQQR
ncbi:hypothetical protein ACFYWS_03300 [Streptomyces sp. NPDC002795]|uniref:hypothetical protein n=1 Tax=Streptomyces sp. NPDC002795 TaxID=3364665 RepID=UPI00369DD7C5